MRTAGRDTLQVVADEPSWADELDAMSRLVGELAAGVVTGELDGEGYQLRRMTAKAQAAHDALCNLITELCRTEEAAVAAGGLDSENL